MRKYKLKNVNLWLYNFLWKQTCSRDPTVSISDIYFTTNICTIIVWLWALVCLIHSSNILIFYNCILLYHMYLYIYNINNKKNTSYTQWKKKQSYAPTPLCGIYNCIIPFNLSNINNLLLYARAVIWYLIRVETKNKKFKLCLYQDMQQISE